MRLLLYFFSGWIDVLRLSDAIDVVNAVNFYLLQTRQTIWLEKSTQKKFSKQNEWKPNGFETERTSAVSALKVNHSGLWPTIENVNELQNEYKSKRTTAREWVEKKEKERQDDERKRERDAFSQQYHAWDGELQSGMHSIFSRVSFQKRSIIFGYLVAKL